MFKRVSKLFEKVAKAEEAGVPIAEDAPVEYHLDEDSDSDDSSDEEEEDSDDDSSDDEAEEGADKKSDKKSGKAKATAAKEGEDDDSDDSDDDDSSSDAAESEGGGADDDVPLTIAQSLESQIYVAPRAEKKKDYLIRSCVVCPAVKLKSDKMIEVHLESGSHQRRFKRYKTFVEKKLTEVERTAAPKNGGADPRGVAAEIAAAQKKDQERAEAQRKHKLAAERAARAVRKSAKAEKKKAEKADKVEGGPNRKARRAAQLVKGPAPATPVADAAAAATEGGAVQAITSGAAAPGASTDGTTEVNSKKRKLDAESSGPSEKRAKRRNPQDEAKAVRRAAKKLAKANKRAGLTAEGAPREKVKKQTKYTAQKQKRTENQRKRDGGWGKVAQ